MGKPLHLESYKRPPYKVRKDVIYCCNCENCIVYPVYEKDNNYNLFIKCKENLKDGGSPYKNIVHRIKKKCEKYISMGDVEPFVVDCFAFINNSNTSKGE